jgi:hypothetical protein
LVSRREGAVRFKHGDALIDQPQLSFREIHAEDTAPDGTAVTTEHSEVRRRISEVGAKSKQSRRRLWPSIHPTLRASASRDRVEAKSPDGDDPEEDEEHEHDELRLLERRLGLRRRKSTSYVSPRIKR